MKFSVTRTSKRDCEEREFNMLEELLAFSNENGQPLVLTAGTDGLPEIEIYDAYRE